MSYVTLKRVSLGSLALYAACAWYLYLFVPIENVYPVFTWNLFSRIPNTVTTYTIAIRSYDGVVYNPPLPFDQSLFLLSEVHRSPSEYVRVIGNLGRAIQSGDTEAIQNNRNTIEAIFAGRSAQYEVQYVRYDPLTHLKTGGYEYMEPLKVFNANTP